LAQPAGALFRSILFMEAKGMLDDENTIALKNKVAELKGRLSGIYAQSFADANKSKAFEAEFSLFLKSCEHARNERADSMKLQHHTVLAGLTIMVAASVLSIYVFTVHIFFGMLLLLGFGFIGCSFLLILLGGEIRVQRAEDYCADLEAYFKEKRWSMEQHEKLGLPAMPMWEEYRAKWNRDAFVDGPYSGKTLYAPFRIAITFVDLMALAYIVFHLTVSHTPAPWPLVMICVVCWMLVVSAQMLLVRTIIFKVDPRLSKEDDEGVRISSPFALGLNPGSCINVLKLFFLLDIIFPVRPRREA